MGNIELPKSSQQEIDSAEPSRWQENHGNVLLGVIGIILVLGFSVIAFRQTRSPGARSSTNPILRSAADRMLLSEQQDGDGLGDRQTVVVRVIGAASDVGMMRLAVYTGPDGFNDPEQALGVDSWTIRNGVCEGRFVLPAGIDELAIATFHDENNNGKLDHNFLGIPTERYGFTGNVRGLVGPPEYSEAVVPITAEPIQISIR